MAGVAVDKRDHVWITHRPSTLQPNETRSIWKAAPPVLEFDADGSLVSAWGSAGAGYDWPQFEHGIYVDEAYNVWLGAGGDEDAHILKFTRDGKFLMQIGQPGPGPWQQRHREPGGAGQHGRRRRRQRLYVADGYVNHRIIVFDAATGTYNATGAHTATGRTTDSSPARVRRCQDRPVSCRTRTGPASPIERPAGSAVPYRPRRADFK